MKEDLNEVNEMVIKLEQIIVDKELQDDIEKEVFGIHKMVWDYLTFDENLKEVNHKGEIMLNSVLEQLKRLEENSRFINDFEAKLKKEDTNYQRNHWYRIYENCREQVNSLMLVIQYIQGIHNMKDISLEKMRELMVELRRYGILKQKVDTELEILKTLKESMTTTQEQLKKTLIEMQLQSDQRIYNMLANVIQTFIDLKSKDTAKVTEELRMLREEIKKQEREPIMIPQPQPIMQDIYVDKRTQINTQLFNELERLIRDEGITDKIELAKRLKVTPKKLESLGYKELVEKYSEITSNEKEIKFNDDLLIMDEE